jgi:hypothetical protein
MKKLPAYLKALGYEVVSFGKVSHYRHTGDYGFDHRQVEPLFHLAAGCKLADRARSYTEAIIPA